MRPRLAVILLAGIVLALLAERFGPGGVQRRGLHAAEEFRELVQPSVAADRRFSAITMGVLTNLTLSVDGEVPDEKALHDLQQMLLAPADAPFRVRMHVTVATGAATRKAE
jgi:hypothetical protein